MLNLRLQKSAGIYFLRFLCAVTALQNNAERKGIPYFKEISPYDVLQ